MNETPMRRTAVNMRRLVEFWKERSPQIFPDIHAAWIGWNEPFCFRCGWMTPLPEEYRNPWVAARSWLQIAHLRDRYGGGTDDLDNLVLLCHVCHRAMPEFPRDAASATEWVRAAQPISCPDWWQITTDSRWGGERFTSFPGWLPVWRRYVAVQEQMTAILAAPDEEMPAA